MVRLLERQKEVTGPVEASAIRILQRVPSRVVEEGTRRGAHAARYKGVASCGIRAVICCNSASFDRPWKS